MDTELGVRDRGKVSKEVKALGPEASQEGGNRRLKMPDDNEFKLKDYERIIDDIIDEYFDQHNINYDLKELMKVEMLGEGSDNLMPDSEMA